MRQTLLCVFFLFLFLLGATSAYAMAPKAPSPHRPPPAVVHQAVPSLVDLHTHLFMDEGMGTMFVGDFWGPLMSRSWKDRFSSQINESTLNESDLGVVVAALYVHPIFEPFGKQALRAQLADAHRFVERNPNWVIATSAAQGREARQQGKRLLVLSLEGAEGLLDEEADYEEFIDRGGIRIVTFAHLTDDSLTSAAFMGGYKRLADPWAWFQSLFRKAQVTEGAVVNPHGLTEKGYRVFHDLMERKIWIDLAHSSDEAVAEMLPVLEGFGQPLLYTHGALRKYLPWEREVSGELLRAIGRSHGIFGLAPSEEYMGDTPVAPQFCPAHCGGKCHAGVYALATQFEEVSQAIGAESVFLGSDFNGALQHLRPTPECLTGTPLDRGGGFFNIGQTIYVWDQLRKLGAPVEQAMFHGADQFLDAWAEVERTSPETGLR